MDDTIKKVIDCFDRHFGEIDSFCHTLKSDEVLKTIAPELKDLGFKVEESEASDEIIKVPVLFSMNNRIDKFFDADAVSADGRIVLEVEAGTVGAPGFVVSGIPLPAARYRPPRETGHRITKV